MNAIDPRGLWEDIVAATADLGSDATALRIPLWVALQGPRPSFSGQAKNALKAAAGFLAVARKTVPVATKAGLLVCFPFSSASNMNNLLPVAREARRRGLLSGIVMGGDYISFLGEFVGAVPIVSIQQLMSELSVSERAKNLAQLFRTYRRLGEAFSERSPKLASALTANRGTFVRALADSVQYGSALRRLLESWLPTCIVSSSDFWPFEHQLCCHASRQGIRSVVVQHGTIAEFWWPFVADLYCMWGEADAEEMRQLGVPRERLAVLGMPATDDIFARSGTVAREQQKDRKPVCLILSHTHGSTFEPKIFEAFGQFLSQAVKSMPSVTWKVKLHPAEDDAFYRRMEQSVFDRLVFHPRNISLQEAVADADVATTVYSTSGLEAMIMDRPLIVAPLTPRVREFAPWPVSGGGIYAKSAEDFRSQFNRLVSDGNFWNRQMDSQHNFLACHFANRGHAAERIVDLLERCSSQEFHDAAGLWPGEQLASRHTL